MLGRIIIAFLLGPLALVAIAYVFAFPWHFAAGVAALVLIPVIALMAMNRHDDAERAEARARRNKVPERQATDLLSPPQ